MAMWNGWSNEQAPEAFGAMVRRQGATGAMPQPNPSYARPGGSQRPPDVIPPGPAGGGYHRPGGYDGSGINPGAGGWQGRGVPQPDPVPRGGEGGGIIPPGPAGGGFIPGQELTKGGEPGGFSGYQPFGKGPGGFQRPGGGYDSSGINPGGMYGGSPIQGGPFGPPRPDMTGGPVGDPAYPVKSGGRPWSYENRNEMQRPGGGYGPYNGYGTPGNGGPIPPGPHGGGPKGFPEMDPSIYPSGWNGYVHPKQTRDQWQQNRLGHGVPQLPQESPVQPTEDWLGRSNGAPQGWNWSR